MTPKQLIQQIPHAVAGAITAITALLHHPILALILFLSFCIYELSEDYYLRDKAYRDILSYSIAIYTTTTLIIIIKEVMP